MSRRTISITLTVVIAATIAVVFLKVRDQKAKAARRNSEILRALTKEDLALVLKSQVLSDPERAKQITSSEANRKAFLKGLKEYLSLAASARREGMAEGQDFELNLAVKEKGLLADLYQSKLDREGKQPFTIKKEEIDRVWTNAENEKEFKAETAALYAVQRAAAQSMESKLGEQPTVQGEAFEKARKAWAKAKILSDRARADVAFMQDRTTQLRLKILEAGILSASYLAKYWSDRIKANEKEIAAYLAVHPEYALSKKREKAELVLSRARAGEDFGSLAQQFSEDRSTKDKGGLYEDFQKGAGLWEEVEAVALTLQPGQIADKLVETKDGYHIVQLVDKTVTSGDEGAETVYLSIRHILLQKRFEDPSVRRVASEIPPPFKTPEEIAKFELEKEKRQQFVDEVIKSENISLPDDFEF
jgi:parvulin-like peptidyl-prolyl isomerase